MKAAQIVRPLFGPASQAVFRTTLTGRSLTDLTAFLCQRLTQTVKIRGRFSAHHFGPPQRRRRMRRVRGHRAKVRVF